MPTRLFDTRAVLLACAALFPAACTWVEPDRAGSQVKVAYENQNLGACNRRGEVTVSVKSSIAGIDRSAMKVRDELESLARNEAATLQATHVQAITEPEGGEQRFVAYDCR